MMNVDKFSSMAGMVAVHYILIWELCGKKIKNIINFKYNTPPKLCSLRVCVTFIMLCFILVGTCLTAVLAIIGLILRVPFDTCFIAAVARRGLILGYPSDVVDHWLGTHAVSSGQAQDDSALQSQ